jgi:hypothetical protein
VPPAFKFKESLPTARRGAKRTLASRRLGSRAASTEPPRAYSGGHREPQVVLPLRLCESVTGLRVRPGTSTDPELEGSESRAESRVSSAAQAVTRRPV